MLTRLDCGCALTVSLPSVPIISVASSWPAGGD